MKAFKIILILFTITSTTFKANSQVDTSLFKVYAPFANVVEYFTGIPTSIQLAQAFKETGFGSAGPGETCNNWFSIKDFDGDYWNGGSCEGWNWNKTTKVNWRQYSCGIRSWIDYAYFIVHVRPSNLNKPWSHWIKNPIKYGGNGYWRRIGTTIERYDLYKYDLYFRA